MVVRWLIEELPDAPTSDPSKSRMPMDMSAVTNLFGQDLDIMFQNGEPDQVRFARCWKSMSKRLETAGQDPLPNRTIDSIVSWASANPPPAPPPPLPDSSRVDLDAIMSQSPPPPDPNVPEPLFGIPPHPPIPGDGQVSSPPAGFTPNGTPAAQNQPDPTAPPLNDPFAAPPPQTQKKSRFDKKSFIKVLAVVAAAAAVIAVVVIIIKNWTPITTTVASWTKQRPAPPVAAAPTQTAAPVQTSSPAPVAPTAPAQFISAKCDYQIEGFGLSNCNWIVGPGPFQCDLGTVDGKAAAKCGEFNYMGNELPTMPARGVILQLKR
jgi:hypothetical protein